jgi:hypothetical protein
MHTIIKMSSFASLGKAGCVDSLIKPSDYLQELPQVKVTNPDLSCKVPIKDHHVFSHVFTGETKNGEKFIGRYDWTEDTG